MHSICQTLSQPSTNLTIVIVLDTGVDLSERREGHGIEWEDPCT